MGCCENCDGVYYNIYKLNSMNLNFLFQIIKIQKEKFHSKKRIIKQ